MKRHIFIICLLLSATLQLSAQQRSIALTISATASSGESLKGQPLTLTQTDYQVSYGALTLNENGKCTVNIYPGNHTLTLVRDGYETVSKDFTADEGATELLLSITLNEKVLTPFSLTTKATHDAYQGIDNVLLTWNIEAPAFFDDFEDYEPFALQFGEWTGIDADGEAAAPLLGYYPNRGVQQYAQIINPLAVNPTWWYEYPILRPYSGKQYVGFTRTNSGNANDDWLISPAITVGNENILSFMGKAADQYPERFLVYITTDIDNPQQADFIRLDQGNYETADYTGWKQYKYNLADYAGKQIKFAIRYISEYNRYGSFMLMVDDVFVGQQQALPETSAAKAVAKTLAKARRAPRHSAANPNERFELYLDGNKVGTTEEYSYLFQALSAGHHVLGVKATYQAAASELATTEVTVGDGNYSKVTFNVSANSKLSPDGQTLQLVNKETSDSYAITVSSGQASIASLPNGTYLINIAEGAFAAYESTIEVSGDLTTSITLTDNILTPYNITADVATDDGTAVIRWNQELNFTDSFEDYDDFATGSFGGWKSVDLDQMPVYPIGLGSTTNIVAFPGSGTATNPTPIPPMVFNPWNTTPAMMPTDVAIAAPTGNKTVIFFSPQQARADKWLISPEISIRDNYALSVTMKSYLGAYPESAEFGITTDGSDQPADFTILSAATNIPAGEWTIYQTDLSAYAGQTVRLGVHYTSYDTFILQLDDFTVGSADNEAVFNDYGNIVRFDIYLDGVKVGESTTPTYTLTSLSDGSHTVGIKAIYQDGESETATYDFNITNGIKTVTLATSPAHTTEPLYNLNGQRVNSQYKGLVIQNGQKHIKK